MSHLNMRYTIVTVSKTGLTIFVLATFRTRLLAFLLYRTRFIESLLMPLFLRI